MKRRDPFCLIVGSEALAQRFLSARLRDRGIKKVLRTVGSIGLAAGGTLLGLAWMTILACFGFGLAFLDSGPMTVTKTVLIGFMAISFFLVVSAVLKLACNLVRRLKESWIWGRYIFTLKERNLFDEWVIEADPREPRGRQNEDIMKQQDHGVRAMKI